jgi:excisionase family DNA binding protein
VTRHLEELFAAYPVHLSVANLASVLGVTQKTAYDYLQAGDLPAYRIGTRWLILRDEVKDFLAMSSKYTAPESLPGALEVPAAPVAPDGEDGPRALLEA